MNDRYLFKAKRIDNGELAMGNLVYSEDADEEFRAIIIPIKESCMYTDRKEEDLGFEDWYKVDGSTLCQCTGLKDKNGTLIWENDVVRWQGKLYVVKWFDSICSFVLYQVCGHWNHMEMNYGQKLECFDYEVIGSYIDNPELLEAK